MGRDGKIVSSRRQHRVVRGCHVKVAVQLRLWRESQDTVGVFRVINNGPRTLENHENFLRGGGLGLDRSWSRLLGLLARAEEKRKYDNTGQRNHAGAVAAGFHWFLLLTGLRDVRKLRTRPNSTGEPYPDLTTFSARSGGLHWRPVGRKARSDKNRPQMHWPRRNPPPSGWRPREARRKSGELRQRCRIRAILLRRSRCCMRPGRPIAYSAN